MKLAYQFLIKAEKILLELNLKNTYEHYRMYKILQEMLIV
jgi:hypothetical protein